MSIQKETITNERVRREALLKFLPTNREEMEMRGWKELDVLLVSGDAYVSGSESCRSPNGKTRKISWSWAGPVFLSESRAEPWIR